jgi:hypothetical protein
MLIAKVARCHERPDLQRVWRRMQYLGIAGYFQKKT